jgi:hypothetical protein
MDGRDKPDHDTAGDCRVPVISACQRAGPSGPFSERSELGRRLAARRQFAPAIHWRTRRFFLTLRLCGCQQERDNSKGCGAMKIRIRFSK